MKANRHFTVQQAWGKYLASETGGGGKKYGYSQYCALFAEHARVKDVVATLRHEPGRAMLVDWAGDALEVVDAVTGEVTRLYLFVAVLSYSGAVFCRGFTDMKSPAWIAAHVAAFEFFGGGPQLVVPDNLRRPLIVRSRATQPVWSTPGISSWRITTQQGLSLPWCANPATRLPWNQRCR
ncbi:DDE-type integrase/transposase/recombinase [uncultured Arthrobacter sp.]|uniref:DDE-type integrase/transposase/recombinase n=1 Tax=uncultured Arthrobacter sp. TaxID=114050 RepID=UPI002608AFFF|nr:DDE-type integrase/transposase/recombinase [uncultured Arthrobacter sp.]